MATLKLVSPGQLGPASLKAGDTVEVSMPSEDGNYVVVGIYGADDSRASAQVEIIGGGYIAAGKAQQTVLRMVGGGKVLVRAKEDVGRCFIVYKRGGLMSSVLGRIWARMIGSQKKA